MDAEDVIANTMFFENNRMNRGRKPLWDRTELRAAVSMVPMASRTTFVNMSKAVHVPKSMEGVQYIALLVPGLGPTPNVYSCDP